MKYWAGRLATACLASVLLVTAAACSSSSKGPFKLELSPSTQDVDVGAGAVEVRVKISPTRASKGTQPAAYQFTLSFDKKILKAESVAEGGYLVGLGRAPLCPAKTVDNNSGQVLVACASFAGGQSGEKSADLAVVKFSPLSSGTSAIKLSDVTLTNSLSDDVQFSTVDGAVTVR